MSNDLNDDQTRYVDAAGEMHASVPEELKALKTGDVVLVDFIHYIDLVWQAARYRSYRADVGLLAWSPSTARALEDAGHCNEPMPWVVK